jgi:lipoprotein-anchoring transpeptidase ErfK/SrfK
MTDLVTSPSPTSGAEPEGEPRVEWAPAPDPVRRRRWPIALWIGIPALALGAAGWYFGTTLIAPGVTISGVPVGGMTVDAAADTVSRTIAETGVEITAGDVTATITGADLGAQIPAEDLAAAALETNPLWQVGGWFPDPDRLTPTLDSELALSSLSQAFAAEWVAPVDASIAYDDTGDTYVVTPDQPGLGVDHAEAEAAYTALLLNPSAPASMDDALTELEADITTTVATERAGELNAMLASAGFYVGDERTVPIEPDTTASWLSITPDPEEGTIDIAADEAAIQAVVDTLPAAVDRPATNGVVVVNNAGRELRTEQQGADGRVLGATAGIAAAFATQLSAGDAAYALDVEVTPAETTSVVRLLEVDLSEQRLYVKENGATIHTWLISSGGPGWETNQGRFTVNAKVRMQDMGNTEVGYLQPDVEWVMYFSGDQAFHAVYWRNIWGTPLSHGCVGMPTGLAKQIYEWADVGTDVWVHA